MKRWMAGLTAALALTVTVAGCGDDPSGGTVGVAAEAVPASSAASRSAGQSAPASAKGGQGREVATYLGGVPGTVGLVVRDTVTGSSWQAGEPSHAAWTASTIKLAIATNLLERSRAGGITLTDGDRDTMRKMLVSSDNAATDALWEKYDGVGMIAQFQQRYGMATLAVVSGYRPYWRHLQCSAEDLAAVMAYALANLRPPDRTQLITWLRAAAGVQQWGVQAAGPDAGHKPGWAFKPEGNPDHWVVHSVGFAGPGERYIIAITYDLPKGRTVKQGAQVISDVVALAFGRERRQVKGP
jgi:beta-lactamase class A